MPNFESIFENFGKSAMIDKLNISLKKYRVDCYTAVLIPATIKAPKTNGNVHLKNLIQKGVTNFGRDVIWAECWKNMQIHYFKLIIFIFYHINSCFLAAIERLVLNDSNAGGNCVIVL